MATYRNSFQSTHFKMHRINQISLHFAIFRIWISQINYMICIKCQTARTCIDWVERELFLCIIFNVGRISFWAHARFAIYSEIRFWCWKLCLVRGRQKFIGYMRFYLYAFVCSCVSEWVCDVCAHTWQVIRNEEISTSFRKASAFTVSSTKFYNTPFVPAIGQIIQWNVNYLGNPVLVYKEQNKMI